MKIAIYRKHVNKGGKRLDFLLDNYKPGNVLDIGNIGGVQDDQSVNNSTHLVFKTKAVNSEVYGFDLYKPKNSERYTNQRYGDVQEGLPYEDRFFDTVYLGELLEHLTDFRFVLSEIKRVLKDDGVFVLDTPNAYSWGRTIRWVCGWEKIGDPTHTVLFTPASLQAMLQYNGFTIHKMASDSKIVGMGPHLLVVAKKYA